MAINKVKLYSILYKYRDLITENRKIKEQLYVLNPSMLDLIDKISEIATNDDHYKINKLIDLFEADLETREFNGQNKDSDEDIFDHKNTNNKQEASLIQKISDLDLEMQMLKEKVNQFKESKSYLELPKHEQKEDSCGKTITISFKIA